MPLTDDKVVVLFEVAQHPQQQVALTQIWQRLDQAVRELAVFAWFKLVFDAVFF